MKNIIPIYKQVVGKIARICGIISALTMMFLVVMTVCDVFLRFFFDKPILGSFELTEYLLVPIVFFAIPWATFEKANVRVELLVNKLRAKTRAKVFAVSCVLTIFLVAILAIYTVPQALYTRDVGTVSEMLDIPAYPFYLIAAVGFFILLFTLIVNLIDFIEEAVAK